MLTKSTDVGAEFDRVVLPRISEACRGKHLDEPDTGLGKGAGFKQNSATAQGVIQRHLRKKIDVLKQRAGAIEGLGWEGRSEI